MSRSSAWPVGGAREKVGRRRRDDDRRRRARELDVIERAARVEQPGVHRAPRERLEGDRADELRRGGRHHDVDFGARLVSRRASHADL